MSRRIATNNLVKSFVNDVATYPLIVSLGLGGVVVTYYIGRLAFQHPDTKAFPDIRKSAIQQNQQKGKDYYNHDLRVAAVDWSKKEETRELFGGMNKAAVASRVKEY